MIIDRAHVRWGIFTVMASVIAAVLYAANTYPDRVHFPLPSWLGPTPPLRGNPGATPLGLIYGTVALMIFIFAALIGWRRNHPSLKVGRIQAWLKAHVWLTILTIPLVLFHCGFHGGGPMTQFLLWLYVVVMLSGFWGLALQNLVPKLMRDYLPEEIIYDEIPYIRERICADAQTALEELAQPFVPEHETAIAHAGGGTAVLAGTESAASLVKFLQQEAMPYLQTTDPRRSRLRRQQLSDDLFRQLKLQVPESRQPIITHLQDLCDEKRRIDFQVRLQHWLHYWLILHAPASILLVVLTLWHAVVAAFTYA